MAIDFGRLRRQSRRAPWRGPMRRASRRGARRPRRSGRLRGIGVACFLETSRGAPNEGAEVRFESDGTVTVAVGTRIERPGPRDRLRPDRRRPAGRADAGDPLRAGRHARRQKRRRPWRRALHAYGRRGRREGDRRGARQGARRSRPIFCKPRRTSWRSPTEVSRCAAAPGNRPRHRPAGAGEERRRSGQPAGRHDTGSRGARDEHDRRLHLSERLPCRRGRDRSRDRRGGPAALHRGRRLRPADQPAAHRGPGAGRRHPGHRPGDGRAHGLRSRVRASS